MKWLERFCSPSELITLSQPQEAWPRPFPKEDQGWKEEEKQKEKGKRAVRQKARGRERKSAIDENRKRQREVKSQSSNRSFQWQTPMSFETCSFLSHDCSINTSNHFYHLIAIWIQGCTFTSVFIFVQFWKKHQGSDSCATELLFNIHPIMYGLVNEKSIFTFTFTFTF